MSYRLRIAEFISSCEAEPFSIFLQRLKFASKKDFNQYLNFRLVVIDFSWQIMHSVLHSLNQQTIPEYADVVYRVAQQPDLMRTEFSDHSWLTCCASNTMKVRVAIKKWTLVGFIFIFFRN